jgi:hypothetical protein
MAREFAYINAAVSLGDTMKLGYGESLGKMICENEFRERVLSSLDDAGGYRRFSHPEISILATCYKRGIPFTVHTGIGTDVIDQHESFDGRAKGGCSGRDFLIYANEIANMTDGGIVLNIGSAVTGPEVLLKAVSMAANVNASPSRLITADFDLRAYQPEQMTDESAPCYYNRDQKSIVTRIPEALEGKGYYIQGNQKQTFHLLFKEILQNIKSNKQ